MAKKKVMVQLTADAVAARKSGMSYGQYMAAKEKPVVVSEIPRRRCKTCGALIPLNSRKTTFCNMECHDAYNYNLDRPSSNIYHVDEDVEI